MEIEEFGLISVVALVILIYTGLLIMRLLIILLYYSVSWWFRSAVPGPDTYCPPGSDRPYSYDLSIVCYMYCREVGLIGVLTHDWQIGTLVGKICY